MLARFALGRRATLAGLAAASARASANGISVVMPVAAALQRQRAGRIPTLPARDIRNGWGVCGSPGEDASVATYADMLGQIGTRDLRVAFVQYGTSAAPRLQSLRQAMRRLRLTEPVPRVTALITAYMNDLTTDWPLQQRALLDFAGSGMLRAIEGPNEIDNVLAGLGAHGPDDQALRSGSNAFPGNFLAWSQALQRFKNQHPALREVTTVSPSLSVGPPANLHRLPDVAGTVDAGNLHFYAGHGRQPSYSMRFDPFVGTFQNMFQWARQAQLPGGPIWLTECGATTSGDYARDGVSQAKYLANQLFNVFAAGGRRMFIYRLIDGSSRPGDDEGNFGLFRHDKTPKPAALMLGGLTHLLSIGTGHDDPRNLTDSAPFTPPYDARRLAVPRLSEAGRDDPSCLVVPKSDGRTLIVVWNEPIIDDGHGHNVPVDGHPLTLDLGTAQLYVVHDLMAPDLAAELQSRRATPRRGRFVDVRLGGYPIIVELLV